MPASRTSAATERLRQVPWEQRPHIYLKEFPQTVGPEALLYWDATYQELLDLDTEA